MNKRFKPIVTEKVINKFAILQKKIQAPNCQKGMELESLIGHLRKLGALVNVQFHGSIS